MIARRTTGGGFAGNLRTLGVPLGLWLFVSAFLWPQSRDQAVLSVLIGLFIAAAAAGSVIAPSLRFVMELVAVLLFVIGFAVRPTATVTTWNDALVAIAVFLVALSPGREPPAGAPPPPTHASSSGT